MSRYVWLGALLVVALTASVVLWSDRSADEPDAPVVPAPAPIRFAVDGGRGWAPHPDRVGLPRRRPQ
jgi:hypothetical protein